MAEGSEGSKVSKKVYSFYSVANAVNIVRKKKDQTKQTRRCSIDSNVYHQRWLTTSDQEKRDVGSFPLTPEKSQILPTKFPRVTPKHFNFVSKLDECFETINVDIKVIHNLSTSASFSNMEDDRYYNGAKTIEGTDGNISNAREKSRKDMKIAREKFFLGETDRVPSNQDCKLTIDNETSGKNQSLQLMTLPVNTIENIYDICYDDNSRRSSSTSDLPILNLDKSPIYRRSLSSNNKGSNGISKQKLHKTRKTPDSNAKSPSTSKNKHRKTKDFRGVSKVQQKDVDSHRPSRDRKKKRVSTEIKEPASKSSDLDYKKKLLKDQQLSCEDPSSNSAKSSQRISADNPKELNPPHVISNRRRNSFDPALLLDSEENHTVKNSRIFFLKNIKPHLRHKSSQGRIVLVDTDEDKSYSKGSSPRRKSYPISSGINLDKSEDHKSSKTSIHTDSKHSVHKMMEMKKKAAKPVQPQLQIWRKSQMKSLSSAINPSPKNLVTPMNMYPKSISPLLISTSSLGSHFVSNTAANIQSSPKKTIILNVDHEDITPRYDLFPSPVPRRKFSNSSFKDETTSSLPDNSVTFEDVSANIVINSISDVTDENKCNKTKHHGPRMGRRYSVPVNLIGDSSDGRSYTCHTPGNGNKRKSSCSDAGVNISPFHRVSLAAKEDILNTSLPYLPGGEASIKCSKNRDDVNSHISPVERGIDRRTSVMSVISACKHMGDEEEEVDDYTCRSYFGLGIFGLVFIFLWYLLIVYFRIIIREHQKGYSDEIPIQEFVLYISADDLGYVVPKIIDKDIAKLATL